MSLYRHQFSQVLLKLYHTSHNFEHLEEGVYKVKSSTGDEDKNCFEAFKKNIIVEVCVAR